VKTVKEELTKKVHIKKECRVSNEAQTQNGFNEGMAQRRVMEQGE